MSLFELRVRKPVAPRFVVLLCLLAVIGFWSGSHVTHAPAQQSKPSPSFPQKPQDPFTFGPPPLQFKDGIPSFGVPRPGNEDDWHEFFSVPEVPPEPGTPAWYDRLPPLPACTVMDDLSQPQCQRVLSYI